MAETPQDAREVERRRQRWADALDDAALDTADVVTNLMCEADREQAALVAKYDRLRAGIEALVVQIEGWTFHRGAHVVDYEEACDLVSDLRDLVAERDAPPRPAQDARTSDARRHADAIADTGTSHVLHPRQYVVACEWCPEVFYGPTKAAAMKQFRAHEDEMRALLATPDADAQDEGES